MGKYEIENVFTSDPEYIAWMKFNLPEDSFDWDGREKVGGKAGVNFIARYIKYLSNEMTHEDYISAKFTVLSENISNGSGSVILGFFNSKVADGKDSDCFGVVLRASSGGYIPHIYLAYNDGTKLEGIGTYTLNSADKYVIAIRYSPTDGNAYLEIFDFLTEQLIYFEEIKLTEGKELYVNQVGLSEMNLMVLSVGDIWFYDMNAISTEDSTGQMNLYCTPEQARKMTNLDAVQDMSDEMLSQIEVVYAMPQVDARFRSEGYQAPFNTGDSTPPLIKTITALLTATYACKKAYTGHAQNESPNYAALLKEVNTIWDAFLKGRMELIDINGSWIERSQKTSTDMLSTTECRTRNFTIEEIGG